jgi:hypothetical protein
MPPSLKKLLLLNEAMAHLMADCTDNRIICTGALCMVNGPPPHFKRRLRGQQGQGFCKPVAAGLLGIGKRSLRVRLCGLSESSLLPSLVLGAGGKVDDIGLAVEQLTRRVSRMEMHALTVQNEVLKVTELIDVDRPQSAR